MINEDKTEALLLGNNAPNSLDLVKSRLKNPSKFWGFTSPTTYNLQFTFNIESTENLGEICLMVRDGEAS